MFGDSDGSKDPGASALASDPAFPNSSNLCGKPTLASAAAPGSSSPPNPAADAADAANAKLCVEFDFLRLYAPERGDPPGDDSSVVGGKKPRLDSLQLSLSPPSDGPGQPSSHPQTQLPSASAADGNLRGASAGAAAAPPPSWTCSATTGRTRSINSDDMFSHNATDICAAGEGTNGSVHSRFSFCPMADGSVAIPTPLLKGGTSSFFPTELPAKMAAAAAAARAGGSFDGGRGGYTSRPDRILREVVSDSVSAMAHVLQDFPSESLEVLREAARSMVDALEKRDELASLQRTLERRSDLTAEALARANRTQLEILVAIKTGTAVFVTGKGRVPSSELVEMFLMTRCRNVNCKTMLPVDDCECKICSSNKGFCGGCMCMVCHKFDRAPNTCSWVGCDVCGHWCHAACGLERNLIRPGPTLKGPIGTTVMQFQCLACSHSSGMFGFVKEVFSCCAENWNADTLVKELDFVRKIFAASDDFEGKGLHANAEEVLSMLSKKVISMLDATNIMLQFFKCETTSPTRVQYGYAMFDAQAAAAAGPSSPTNLADAADEANAKLCIEHDILHLSAKMAVAAAAAAASVGKSRPDRILLEIVSNFVSTMAHVLQDFPSESLSLERLREKAWNIVDALEKRDELASLQRRLEHRSDLTAEALGQANRTQLEILVAIKTGTAVFVTGKGRVPSSELVEMFLMTRCHNVNCKTMLPVDDCECKICSSNKGFCGRCMCMVCHKFDSNANTCSWVGCDVCGHWCHAACALERNLISPGPTLRGPIGTTEMQFWCLSCSHSSEMFGFVKEVFSCCAENWNAETLMKELDLARKVFAASDDFEGKGVHAKAEEVLSMYAKRVISQLAATNIMLQLFKWGVTEGLQHTSLMPRKFPLQLLEHITYNFSKEHIIGRGAYGVVYKGVLDGEEIAVKKLYSLSELGDDQFNECINLMRVQHQNIVRLVGYCYETQHEVVEYDGKPVFSIMEERALCLEYLQGGSLDRHISEEPCGLDWSICYGIIKGICEGLKYLHTGSKNPICHLDLKPGNILLDMDMIPKIGDFGLSRLIGSAETSVAQNPIGTLGYMPPEYIDKQEITPKFDVFSLGVIILQIMAGRTGCFQRAYMPPQEFIEHVHGKWERRLQATMSSDTSLEVNTCTGIALRCVEDDPVKRPTIAEIVDKLNKIHTTKSSSTLE